jgi:hypothetical protein
MFPEAITAATPAPRIFTVPVAMVFRQLNNDLVIRDKNADVIIRVMRDGLGVTTTRY